MARGRAVCGGVRSSPCVCVCVSQMLLPEGIRRDNTKLWEEVEIPPSSPLPLGPEERPVYISDLDQVGALPLRSQQRLTALRRAL